ncbi:MAG: glutamate--cysteine ligase [Candidatus Cloacimonetes bacterium]|nr:glutamate--cysteine ligase [Candidatus Cloacimonadota bacterium]
MEYLKQKEVIRDYLKRGERKPADFIIGAELEYFIVDRNTHNSISFYEHNGIEDLLKKIMTKGFDPVYEADHLIGLNNSELAITLEPGAQFEISMHPQKTISVMEQNYLKFLQILQPLLDENNQMLYASGYLPHSKLKDIKFIPKKRYEFMSQYFRKQGKLALNMMKATSSIQVAIDFSSEQDFADKMLLASRLTPVLSAAYDNSPVFEGKQYKEFCLRTKIWANCDNARCGVIPHVFQTDFGYDKYAEYLLQLNPIFLVKKGKFVKSEKPFREVFDPFQDLDQQLNHIFSICFPDVRARNYIELRMTDSLPYPLNFAYLKIITEIFYNKSVFNKVSNFMSHLSFADVNNAKRETISKGMNAKLGDRKIISIFRDILAVINCKDEHFGLNNKIAENGKITEELLQDGGQFAQ